MSRIVAALDNSAAAAPTLETALALAVLLDADVYAVHIVEDGQETVDAVAARHGVTLHRRYGPATDEIVSALDRPDVVAGVIGARRLPGAAAPAGHTVLDVLQRTAAPIIVVAPDCPRPGPRRGDHVLVPLDDTTASAHAVATTLDLFPVPELDVEVLHVFTPDTVPRFWDKPEHETDLWGHEFLQRHWHGPAHLTLRSGNTATRVLEVCAATHAGLIALGWSQDLSPGHANTVKDVLTRSPVPVMLVPLPSL